MKNRVISGMFVFVLFVALLPAGNASVAGGRSAIALKLVKATATGAYHNPEYAIDMNPKTQFAFDDANSGVDMLFDLGGPKVVESLSILSGSPRGPVYLDEVTIGADPQHMRPLLGRAVDLVAYGNGGPCEIELQPSAGRYLSLRFSGGIKVGIADIEVFGRDNRPERHLLHWWEGDVKNDVVDEMDYLEHDLGVTDIWIDRLASVMPNSRPNFSFALVEKSGVLKELKKRNINYWLAESEGFGGLVNTPDDLRDEIKWQTTLRRAHQIYSEARKLGFRGIAMDAEDYVIPSDPAVVEKYGKVADAVDCWTFNDEFGYSGQYYQRGLQLGKVIKEVWGCPVIQFYEAVLYAGKPGCRRQ